MEHEHHFYLKLFDKSSCVPVSLFIPVTCRVTAEYNVITIHHSIKIGVAS